MDSWVICEAFIRAVRRVKKQTVHLIGMYKTPKTKFTFEGEQLTHSQIRWTVEVFFKEAKQLLGLGRCQSNDFDAQIADTTITMIQHILLTLMFRFEHYETKGALFSHIREGIIESRLNERLWGLFIELIKVLEVLFDDVDEMDLLQRILEDEKAYEMISRLLPQDPNVKNAA